MEKLAAVTEQDTDSEMTTSTETDNTTGNDDDDSDDISGNGVRDIMMMLKLSNISVPAPLLTSSNI